MRTVALIAESGPGAMGPAVARALERLGLEVRFVEAPETRVRLESQSLSRLLRPINAMAVRAFETEILVQLIRSRSDLVLFQKSDRFHRSFYRALRRLTPSTLVAFHPDDPFNTGSLLQPAPSHRRALIQLQEVDLVLTWSHRLMERISRVTDARVEFMPFAFEPPAPGAPSAKDFDVGFVGTWDHERETWLSSVADLGLRIWGSNYWTTRCRNPKLSECWQGRPMMGEKMTEVVRSTAINLNILRIQNKNACNMRSFEIPGAGGFLLQEQSSEYERLFRPGEHFDSFRSVSELREKIRYYLENPGARERIAANGFALAQNYTYDAWARRMLDVV